MNGCKFDDDGNVIPIGVTIVWGAPASGKTTYVRKHKQPGDLVVDLDLIKQAISMADKTEAGDNLLPIATKLRDQLYDIIAKREVECEHIWVIAGLPQKEQRDQLMRKIKATDWKYCIADKQECIDRAMKDNERVDKEKQRQIITKWFDQFYYEK